MAKLTTAQKLGLEKRYEEYIEDEAGKLHNQIITLISQNKIPLIQALLVLEVLIEETKRKCFERYLGEK